MDSVKFSLYQRLNIIGIAVGILYFALRYGALLSIDFPEYSSASTRESPVLQPTTAKPVASTQDNVDVSTPVNQSAIEKNITININDSNIIGYVLDTNSYRITRGSTVRIVGWNANDEALEVHFGSFGWKKKDGLWLVPKRDAFLAVPITIRNNTGRYLFKVGFESENQIARSGFIYNDVYPGDKRKEKTLLDVTSQKDHEIILTLTRFRRSDDYQEDETIDRWKIPLLYTPTVPAKINASYQNREELSPRIKAREKLPESPLTMHTIDVNYLSEDGYLIDNGSLFKVMGLDDFSLLPDREKVVEIHFDHFRRQSSYFNYELQWNSSAHKNESVLLFTYSIYNPTLWRIRASVQMVDSSTWPTDILPRRRLIRENAFDIEHREEYAINVTLTLYSSKGEDLNTVTIPFIYRPVQNG